MAQEQTKAAMPSADYRDDVESDPPRAAGDGPAERPCLACGTVFLSEGWHNRLCRRCAKRG